MVYYWYILIGRQLCFFSRWMFLLRSICNYATARDLFIAYNHVVYKHIDTGSATTLLRQKQDEWSTRLPGRVG